MAGIGKQRASVVSQLQHAGDVTPQQQRVDRQHVTNRRQLRRCQSISSFRVQWSERDVNWQLSAWRKLSQVYLDGDDSTGHHPDTDLSSVACTRW